MENTQTHSLHHSTFELTCCQIQLRPGLNFELHNYKQKTCYIIEDTLGCRYFRVGASEYDLISCFDGKTTIAEAVAKSSASMGQAALDEQQAISVCQWLLQSNLATTEASRTTERLYESGSKYRDKKRIGSLHPLTPKLELFNPDQFLGRLTPWVGWLFSLPLFLVWLVVVASAVYYVSRDWETATSNAFSILDNYNWVYLGLIWIVLKLLHELAHGVVCTKLGGSVKKAGFVLILFIPLPFVDASSTWKFRSKWKRIQVAGAGMYAEVFVAAVAAVFWGILDDGLVKQLLFQVMVAGSLTTLLFNANPLMRFDGYYILSDWLELPNLATHSQQWLKWFGKRYYLGENLTAPKWPEGSRAIVVSYAVLSLIWRVVIYSGLILAAESLFFGLGRALSLIAIGYWIIWPIGKLILYVFVRDPTRQRPSRTRFTFTTVALVSALWAFLAWTPWYSRIEAPAIVDFQKSVEVRTSVGGFVHKVAAQTGDWVRKNEPVLFLRNEELEHEIQQLNLELDLTQLRAGTYKTRDQIPQYQIEIQNESFLRKRLNERKRQHELLIVRAPQEGRIIGDLSCVMGTFFAGGELVCSVCDDAKKEVRILVAQNDLDSFTQRTSKPVCVRIWGAGLKDMNAELEQVLPRARTELPHPGFGSTAGGPLAVRFQPVTTNDSESKFELVEPRFLAKVKLSESDANLVNPGQQGIVCFRSCSGTFGSVAVDWIHNWFFKKTQK